MGEENAAADGPPLSRQAAGTHPGSGTAVAYVELAAQPRTPSWARRHAQAVLGAWNISPDTIDTAVLLVSELVTNACATHSAQGPDHRASIVQTLRYQPGRIIIEVSDNDPRPPVLANAEPDAESGRGLTLVQALSKEWSYFYPPSGGKTVYCILNHHDTERLTP